MICTMNSFPGLFTQVCNITSCYLYIVAGLEQTTKGLGQRQDYLKNSKKEERSVHFTVLLRQGEPGTSQYISYESVCLLVISHLWQ